MARKVECHNKGLYNAMSQFELKARSNGKTTLGTGSFGAVHLAQHNKTSQLYAIKAIQSTNIQTAYEQEGIEREIKVHSRCQHQNIVTLYDSFQEQNNVYMVLEYVENGNLYNHIQKRKRLDEKEACKYFVQTCKALQYLHENNVFHRDIKPENLLLDSNNDVKLCDFGWCAENIHLKRKTFCGTYEYMAPEIVTDIAYDFTIDIWSVGVLLYEMLHGYAPFKGKEYKDIQASIKSGLIRYSSSVPQDAQDLIRGILMKDPQARLSFKQIFQSPFVQRCAPPSLLKLDLKVNISPRSSFSLESAQLSKYQSPLVHQKTTSRCNLLSSSISIKSPNLSKTKLDTAKKPTLFEDIKKKILFDQTSPLKDSTNMTNLSSLNSFTRKKQTSLTQLFKQSNTKIDLKSPEPKRVPLNKFNSKTKNYDENSHKLLDQLKSMPSMTQEDQFYHIDEDGHIKTDRVKGQVGGSYIKVKRDQQQDLDKILKMYLSLCSSSRQ